MKKTILILLVAAIPSVMSAQLKVNSNGNVFIKNGNLSSNAQLTISDASSLSGYISNDYNPYVGTRSQGYATNSTQNAIGVIGEGHTQNNNGVSVGVWGESYGSSSKNFALVGMMDIGNTGAGVYATTEGSLSYFTSGTYAAYLVGETYIDGCINTLSLYNPSDMRLRENVMPLSQATRGQSPLAKLQNLEVVEYNMKRPSSKEVSDRLHYGVSAQELQEIYPNLVKEGQDGYLKVNYVEMVPLLLRSIQELKQELDELKGGSEFKTRSTNDETPGFSAINTDNVLYQNNPNPFKEQTVIRFKLADNVQEAAICIFDMTGKTIKKLPISSGMESVSVGGYELGEGMFLYSLIVNGKEIDTKRMIIAK